MAKRNGFKVSFGTYGPVIELSKATTRCGFSTVTARGFPEKDSDRWFVCVQISRYNAENVSLDHEDAAIVARNVKGGELQFVMASELQKAVQSFDSQTVAA